MSIITYIKNNPSKLITGAIGLTGLGFVTYDAHNLGKIQSDLYASERDAKWTQYFLNNDMYVSKMSRTEENIRDWAFQTDLGQGIRRVINAPIGYTKGFFSMLVSHVVPLALSIGAIFGKGAVSKGSAIGVVAYGIYKVIKNVFGFGTPGGLGR